MTPGRCSRALAVALHAAIEELNGLGWDVIRGYDDDMARRLRDGLADVDGVRLLGPSAQPDGPSRRSSSMACPTPSSRPASAPRMPSASVTAVFFAHPYLLRPRGMSAPEVADCRAAVLSGDRWRMPGAVLASAGIANTRDDLDRFLHALAQIASGEAPRVPDDQYDYTGDFWSEPTTRLGPARVAGAQRLLGPRLNPVRLSPAVRRAS